MPRRRRPRGPGSPARRPHDERPQQRNAANARERARMRVLSKAFCRLKTTLPWVPADTKLSKLDTLRLATSYIAHLRAILTDEDVQPSKHPLNLTWPFSFAQQPPPAQRSATSPEWNVSRDANRGQGSSSSSSSSSCPDGELDDDPAGAAPPHPHSLHHHPYHHHHHHHHNLHQYSDSLLHIG